MYATRTICATRTMRLAWRVLLFLTLIPTLGALATPTTPARAQTTVSITAHFIENTAKQAGCSVFLCGTGMVTPFGQATDELVPSVPGCPPCGVSVKTFYLASGTLVFDETVDPNGFSCATDPAGGQANSCGLFTGHVTDVLAQGTGAFAGASGSLDGLFSIANLNNPTHSARVDYTGTLILP